LLIDFNSTIGREIEMADTWKYIYPKKCQCGKEISTKDKYCHYCGESNIFYEDSETKYCTNCGASLPKYSVGKLCDHCRDWKKKFPHSDY